jgi:hypothetical protein
MRARYFERELIHEFNDEGEVVRYQRMTFTPDELRGIAVMLAAGMGIVGYTFTSRTITEQFQDAWHETEYGGGISVPK